MNKRFYLGLILFILSYSQFLLPQEQINFLSLSLCLTYFMLGISLVCDGITKKLYNKSLLREIFRNKKNFTIYILISLAGGVMLDGIAQWLGKLWIYPYFSNGLYPFIISFLFALYWLVIVESYLGVKALLDYMHKGKTVIKSYYTFEPAFYKTIGVLGVLLIIGSVFFILYDYGSIGGYVFEVTNQVNYDVNFIFIVTIFLGVWFVFESIEYYRKETSLLKDIFHHYFNSLGAILIASFGLALIMESQNIPNGLWRYTNWPLEHIQFIGLPVLMFIAWPLHYIAFLSLYRAFSQKQTEEFWKGDAIK